ncbi:MAG: DsbA family oxidoreductase [Actinomycetota bacterium]|nr:DsbA family oxidoreductase [Actinomycetota bacterium]
MKVEIWSDVVCPWCHIGKRRFEAALARFAHRDDVEVVWRSFELAPDAPRHMTEPLDRHLASKYGVPLEQARAMQQRMTGTAADEGLTFRFDIARSGNTFDAHRVLHLAAERGVQDAVKEAFFRAYLTDGEPIGDPDTLVRVAAGAGLDADEVRRVLGQGTYGDAVRADEREAAALGVSGVPFFVVDRTYGVSGAQPAELLLEVLEKAWADAHPLTLVTSGTDDASCADGSCAV